MRVTNYWELPGLGTVYEIEDHGFTGPEYDGKPLYAYGPGEHDDRGRPKVGEYHRSLDRALVAMVGQKYTGPRGAGGSGVGTAADWFARMIGMDQLVEVNHSDGWKAIREVLARTDRALAVADELEARGFVLATRVQP